MDHRQVDGYTGSRDWLPRDPTHHESEMHQSRRHSVITWLCLFWVGLSQLAVSGGLVVCRDGLGGTRIEWGCGQNASRGCGASSGGERDSQSPPPCQDEPVDRDVELAGVPGRPVSNFVLQIPAPAALVSLLDTAPGDARIGCPGTDVQVPPAVLRHIRTVILLV